MDSGYNVLLRGQVCKEDRTPVSNATVIIEMVLPINEQNFLRRYNCKYCLPYSYTVTNDDGEFCFRIYDVNHYYKIKVFDNSNLNEVTKEKFYINI